MILIRRVGGRAARTAPKWIAVRDLRPSEDVRNPDNIENLRALFSLHPEDEWPDGLPPIFVLSDGEVRDGHHRLKAAKLDGRTHVLAVEAPVAAFRSQVPSHPRGDLMEDEDVPQDVVFAACTGWEWPMSWDGC